MSRKKEVIIDQVEVIEVPKPAVQHSTFEQLRLDIMVKKHELLSAVEALERDILAKRKEVLDMEHARYRVLQAVRFNAD
jgi:hypothetical protein